jgi:carbamoyl-phosphate synthase large subunit
MGRLNILVTGVGGGGFGMEVVKALKSSSLDCSLVVSDISEVSFGFADATKFFTVPKAGSESYIENLSGIIDSQKVSILFPGSEPELRTVSDHRAVFEKMNCALGINSKEVIDLCMDKQATMDALRKLGFRTPKAYTPEDAAGSGGIDFPVIIKPRSGSGGSNNVFIAQDKDEMVFFSGYIGRHGGFPYIQEYLGSPEDEYTVGVLSGTDSRVISVSIMNRSILASLSNRIKIPSIRERGKILAVSSGVSQGRFVRNDIIKERCIDIANAIGSLGPLNIQGRLVNGTFIPFEINPRLSGTTNMRALAGVNEPELIVRERVLKEKLPDGLLEPKIGIALRGLEDRFFSG